MFFNIILKTVFPTSAVCARGARICRIIAGYAKVRTRSGRTTSHQQSSAKTVRADQLNAEIIHIRVLNVQTDFGDGVEFVCNDSAFARERDRDADGSAGFKLGRVFQEVPMRVGRSAS